MAETFGGLVKRFRNQIKLSQKRLAKDCGLSLAQIVRIEGDDTHKNAPKTFRIDTLERLANGLRLSQADRNLLFEVAWEREQQYQARTSDLARLVRGLLKTSSTDEESKEGETPDYADDRQKYSQPRVLVRLQDVADIEPHDRTPEVRSTDITDRSSRALQLKGTHDSAILLEILRRSRENYPRRTKLHGTKINWDDYDRKYPTVQEKISNDTWYDISDTGSFFEFMGTMVKYEYVNPDVLFDIVYIDKKLWYDNKDFTDNMRREYNEHLWEEWEYLIKLLDKRYNKD
jgi:transcriptional regulator with XRE-family HTH domain